MVIADDSDLIEKLRPVTEVSERFPKIKISMRYILVTHLIWCLIMFLPY